ncbi:MAG: zinc carboxypeptidase [Cyclobacteriaceae bacterium]|nr:zinc carboxypeptidase [Cyclobacteriaceae bacterium]
MRRELITIFLILLSVHSIQAQSDLDYYLPDRTELNPDIPAPADVLGYPVGEKHVSHDDLVKYLTLLADVSDRIELETYGYTHEGRPLLLLTVSSPGNLKDIENIRKRHVQFSDPDDPGQPDPSEEPVVIWMGYSVHGNEASGSNASLLVAWYLAANISSEMNDVLEKTVVLIDPCINPDGFSRFAQWVNQFRSKVTITDPNSLELNEPWPGGRTNHYWMDLNRDWLLLQQPESKARLAKYFQWLPNILTDHHEMDSNGTFFFQPGIPSRNNPSTPESNIRLTEKIAAYHAKALDRIGSLYYARESFDDFYYGKGSTYPDINGSIGILFEQASSRGYSRSTNFGNLTFPFTIRNQFATSLSTLRAGFELREELLKHQQDFYTEAIKESREDQVKGYIFDPQGDQMKMHHFEKVLDQHQIKLYRFSGNKEIAGHMYNGESSLLIPTNQRQYKLIRNLFENTLEYKDSLFYDVSAWTLPPAFDLHYDILNERELKSLKLTAYTPPEKIPAGRLTGESSYGYLLRWNQYNSPMALYRLQEKGIRILVAERPFTTAEGETYQAGTLFIPVKTQGMQENTLRHNLAEVADQTGMDIYPVSSGYTLDGINLGSPNITPLTKPVMLLLVGEGISSYEAGEVWHLFDARFRIPVSLVSVNKFNTLDLNDYNKIIMVNGNYRMISDQKKDELKKWLEKGGHIIAYKGGAKWLATQKMAFIEFRQTAQDTLEQKRYADLERNTGAQAIGGSIFRTRIDLSHPLCYGYPDDELCIFKNEKYFFERSKNPYNIPVLFDNEPLVSGYVSAKNYENIKNSSAVTISAIGLGRTICFSDNPLFRNYWFGTNRLFLNAVFLGELIRGDSAR